MGCSPRASTEQQRRPPPLPAGPWPVAVRNTNAEGWNSRLGWGTRLREGATPSSLRRHLTAKWVFNIPSVTQQAVVSVLILDFFETISTEQSSRNQNITSLKYMSYSKVNTYVFTYIYIKIVPKKMKGQAMD